MHYVYIIYSPHLKIKYTGSTSDLKKRINDHKKGFSEFTSRTKDWKLVYYEAFLSKKDALREEKFLKTGKGKERIEYLLTDIY